MRLAVLSVAVCVPLADAADPPKPVTPAFDELAVLADERSPDRAEVLKKYEGKVLKLTGNVVYHSGGVIPQGGGATASTYYSIRFVGKKPADVAEIGHVEWSKDPSARPAIDRVQAKASRDADRRMAGQKVANPGLQMTVYGRLHRGRLVDLTDDPKTGGVEYRPKEKEPARLKPKK